ncbi:polyprenyl diphosphate synthase [Aurantiacibacter aquimixticola]|uniref:Isoprenyl transferase n=1 Tax=Aurantiacibacter aquimixticola TaxID=1958945 RepID=A0A419RRC9_9SPHN|nr:polyprenyl diphosphate synthase [Aurantiacibacter aquimixticola]RJY08341.1 di-trans,poly-cis-decaprenylcistransferase [Aurantiacibacter aquimixticola]
MSQPNYPRHVAIIMDGNGRWAKKRGLPRALGHKQGGEAVRRIVEAAGDLGLECLTLYAFSSENWKREQEEISDLMNLMRRFIAKHLDEFIANRICLQIIGDYKAFEPDIVAKLEDALERTKDGERTLAVALNYGAQQEIARAALKASEEGSIDAKSIERHLFTADLPPLDLLIRTSGEVRLSNFLLWQSAYAEMLFVDTLWPDFGPEELRAACDEFANRERRYGGR